MSTSSYGVTPILYRLCSCGCGTNVCSQLGNHKDIQFMPAFYQPHRNMAWGGGPMCEGCRLIAFPSGPPVPINTPPNTPQSIPPAQVFHRSPYPNLIKKPLEQNDFIPINPNTPYSTEELKTEWEYQDESSLKKDDLKNYEPA